MLRPTVLAIPFFALMIAGEALWHHWKGTSEYKDRKDTWGNIFLGFMSVVFGALFGLGTGLIYLYFYDIAPYKFPADAWYTWTILFFADDFLYYVFHRVSHETRLFWNFHVVHHSSEQYNLSVAVRQSWFSGILHWLFYAPLMLAGFAPWMFATMHGFNLIYQFWIHTKLIYKFPRWFEYVFNTPSHHRVHHGVNEQYLDKNYAGVLIVWDRMFGSFIEETETPRYGIIKPIRSYNPLWVNTHAWFEMFDAMKSTSGIGAKLRCLLGPPGMELAKANEN
ncbi:MAG: sterol desaturase family protein [Pyrinomonadaceae bacterium]|nr:sterol desaturase family protein [Pyrinomonadaceae bacterium]MBP6211986.1 sterol desaturase family protein [Pyrinomonadaceae bacterium]